MSKILYASAVSFMLGLCGYGVSLFPQAAQVETVNQRTIAAGSYKHQMGYSDYVAFTEANDAH